MPPMGPPPPTVEVPMRRGDQFQTSVTARPKSIFQTMKPSTRHRLQFAAAILGTIGAVYAFSLMIKPSRVVEPPKPMPAATFVPAPSIIPRFDPPIDKPDFKPLPKVNPAFMAAVGEGDIPAMERLYTEGMPMDGALAVAVKAKNKAVAVWLLDHKADVHENETSSSESLLLLADDQPDMTKLLLDRGAGEPDLQMAAVTDALTTVTRILAKSRPAAKEVSLSDVISAHSEAPAKRRVILERLIAAGADLHSDDGVAAMNAVVGTCDLPDETDDGKKPPIACLGMIQLLGSKGAKVNSDALTTAAALGDPLRMKVLDALLAQRLEPDATTVAIGSVVGENGVPTIKKLASRGVIWNYHDGEADATAPLLDAIERIDAPAVKAMLEAGAPLDTHFKDGRSPLGVAIDKISAGDAGDVARIIELLIGRGANLNRRLPDGRTPLFAAAESGEIRVINAMLDRGARVNEVILDQTALDAAEANGHIPAARVLHARGGRRARTSDSELPKKGDL